MSAGNTSLSPLETAKQRVRALEAELRDLEQYPELERRNQELATELEALESRLFDLLAAPLNPRHSDEALQQAEVLRLAAVEYCQQSKTDPELWKNIAF